MQATVLSSNYVVPIVSTSWSTYNLTPSNRGMPRTAALWRFHLGQKVYVRNWPSKDVLFIKNRVEGQTWPHYICHNAAGDCFMLSQLYLSSKTIETR
jgi:hypothetical protein